MKLRNFLMHKTQFSIKSKFGKNLVIKKCHFKCIKNRNSPEKIVELKNRKGTYYYFICEFIWHSDKGEKNVQEIEINEYHNKSV